MQEKVRILFLSANPWTTTSILVDEEAREIFKRLEEGPHRSQFELHKHPATRPVDLQRLLLLHEPHIVHFSGHGAKRHGLILGGSGSRGKTVDSIGLAEVLGLYKSHVKLVLLNACFTQAPARRIAKVIDYSIGTSKELADKTGVAFASAFYRALGFGKPVRAAFDSAKAELALTKLQLNHEIELFVREGVNESESFPRFDHCSAIRKIERRSETRLTVTNGGGVMRIKKTVRSEITLHRESAYSPRPLRKIT